MIVKELVEKLRSMEQDLEVVFATVNGEELLINSVEQSAVMEYDDYPGVVALFADRVCPLGPHP